MAPSEATGDEPDGRPRIERGGRSWERGTPQAVAWIQQGFRMGVTIASSVPPVFDAYATIVDPWSSGENPMLRFDRDFSGAVADGAWLDPEHAAARDASKGWQVQARLVEILSEFGSNSWWLGYLDTGASDVVFEDVPSVRLSMQWPYKVVKAGPAQALSWRVLLPDLIFPVDRSWCVSTGWDDSWTSLGGSAPMIEALVADPVIAARQVFVDQDATPPGHVAV